MSSPPVARPVSLPRLGAARHRREHQQSRQLDRCPTAPALNVQLFLDVQGGAAPNPVPPPPVTVKLFGPGDVIGVDPRYVIRTEPRPLHRQLRAQLSLRHRIRYARFSLAVHARRAQWRPAASLGCALIVLKPAEFAPVSLIAPIRCPLSMSRTPRRCTISRFRGTGPTCRSAATLRWPTRSPARPAT